MRSEINYAKSGDVDIAYRVFGAGPRDLVLIPGTLSHAELYWDFPTNQYLAEEADVVRSRHVFDKRGQGLSDRVGEQTLEERIGDVRAVMEAAGSARATIFGWSEGGPMSLTFSATYSWRDMSECEVAGSKVSGIAVHTGARVAGAARPREVLVSGTVKDLVAGSGIRFEDRGAHVLKGLPGSWRLFAVT